MLKRSNLKIRFWRHMSPRMVQRGPATLRGSRTGVSQPSQWLVWSLGPHGVTRGPLSALAGRCRRVAKGMKRRRLSAGATGGLKSQNTIWAPRVTQGFRTAARTESANKQLQRPGIARARITPRSLGASIQDFQIRPCPQRLLFFLRQTGPLPRLRHRPPRVQNSPRVTPRDPRSEMNHWKG